MARPWAELVGDPVAHSLSPVIFRHWFEALNVEGDYRSTRLGVGDLGLYLERRESDPDWQGCNLTMPLKQAIFPLIACQDEGDRRIGAFNLVARTDKKLAGYNSDRPAIQQLLEARGARPERAAVIGSGGAALAALEAFRRLGVRRTILVSRDPTAASALLDTFELEGETVALGTTPVADLLVNASPLGMKNESSVPVDLSLLPPGATIFDMVYAPFPTALLVAARAQGLAIIDGLEMLIRQAALSFSLLFGAVPDESDFAALKQRLTSWR